MKREKSTIWFRGIFYSLPVATMIGLLFIWNTTSPPQIGPAGIFLVFILLYLFWLGIFFTALHLGGRLLSYFNIHSRAGIGHRTSYYIASVIAFIPVSIVAMQSVGQLEIRDIFLVIIFASLAIFYIIKRA